MTLVDSALGLASAVAGVSLLRSAWTSRGERWRMAAGWAALALGPIGWRLTGAGWDKACGLALMAPSLVAVAVLACTADLPSRPARSRLPNEAALEPSGAGAWWRTIVRALCVGPLAGAAAVGCAAALALKAPWGAADRLVAAGMTAPVIWAAAAVWATTDARLLRIGLGLGALGLCGFGLAAS